MKKGEVYEGTVKRYAFPNKGYVSIDDREICIKGALPGQQIQFLIKRLKKGAGEGRLLEVLKASELEDATPLCQHFGACGGCVYQTMSYQNQLCLKENQVKDLLAPFLCKENVWEGMKGSPVTRAYRNKMEFSFGDEYKGGPLALGMHKKGGFYDIVTVDNCCIVDSDFNAILRTVLNFYSERQIPFYKKMQHTGVLRHLVVRQVMCSKDILVNLVTTTQGGDKGPAENGKPPYLTDEELAEGLYLNELKEQLLALPLNGKIAGILHTHNDSLSDAVVPEKMVTIYGQDYLLEEILGLKFKISPFSFFQTNSKGAEVLYETVRDYIGETEDKVVFDLYSGTGTIAQMLAPVAKKVIGVEIVEEAVEAATENAALNGLANCEFIAGDVLKVLDGISEKPDIIILDPPREGCNPKALSKIIAYGVEEMVYISCKPTSLVRDLVEFQKCGYEVRRAGCVDMFPHTGHVETCVLLTHKKPTSYIEVTMDYDTIVPNQKLGRATYKMITEYVKEKYNLVVKSTTIAEVKRSLGFEVGDYNVKEEKTNYRKEKVTPEKVDAIKDALKYFGVIE